jgi:hypothetical protein
MTEKFTVGETKKKLYLHWFEDGFEVTLTVLSLDAFPEFSRPAMLLASESPGASPPPRSASSAGWRPIRRSSSAC